ncbi:nucleotide disphospho-sugar-binding domain-containing protein [Actinoallomurus soli]|uniref:nucleotide disphospho-sugar-binding domain-containing protein n=1 Tax=Actinoallomurus soli TaxID=2952535 RepID=UPI002092972B|nr:nucleotide disphospho-sugar-binding domain-containing protein [Actinoallomurus soli]MCO5967867.1 DUF1205 domain-containing protein [Actinoallomurus soli]
MRILFVVTGSQPTYFSVAPLATAARNAGHQVMLAAHEPWVKTAESIGLPTFCYATEPIRKFMGLPDTRDDALRLPPTPPDEQMLGQGRGFARMGRAGLEPLLELAGDWAPDVVVGSALCFGAMLLTARLKLPYVRHIENQIPVARTDVGAAEELRADLERLGLDGLPQPDLILDATPPSLRPSDAPGPAQPLRWIPSNPQRRLERWVYNRPEGRRRVLITSGSRSLMFHDQGWGMRQLVGELTGMGVDVLIAASPGNRELTAHQIPDRISVAERFGQDMGDVRVGWIPMDAVAPTCDLAVNHGGATTVLTLLAGGVPQLIIPEGKPDYHRDAVAQSLSDFGAGRSLWPQAEGEAAGREPGEVIAAACRDMLAEPGYTERAHLLAKEIAAQPTPAEVVPMLEALISR